MPIERTQWRVLLTQDQTVTEHVVEVTHRDQMQAETFASQYGVKIADKGAFGITWNTIVIYAALMRTGVYKDAYPVFVDRDLVDLDIVRGDDGNALKVSVGPTTQTEQSPNGSV